VDDETIEYVWAARKTGIEAKRTAAFGIEILSLAAGRVGVLENILTALALFPTVSNGWRE
jgi:hypothetical protein